MMAKTKYIFITGGVVSSLGKGIAAASIGALLESKYSNLLVSALLVGSLKNKNSSSTSLHCHARVT